MWKVLVSRKFAVYILSIFLVILFVSALIPDSYTVPEQEWLALQQSRPALFWIYSHCSTPFLIKSPPFQLVSLLLFLSTLACTIDRLIRWQRSRASEFSKEKAFSFATTELSLHPLSAVQAQVEGVLRRGRWERSQESGEGGLLLSGQKGMSGFWGSVVFHIGLLCCFLAGPVTALTGFSGQLIVPEGIATPLRGGVTGDDGNAARLPKAEVMVHDLRGAYFEGQYKYDFGGRLAIDNGSGRQDLPFAVNRPADYRGYQFSLHEYGNAPRLVLERGRGVVFDYFLNLRHPEEGDYFEIEPGVRALVMFFPDFIRQGGRIGTRSREPRNPVTMVKLYRGEREVFKGLFRPGEEGYWEGTRITVPDYRHWVTLLVTREQGIKLVIVGFLLGVTGLFARFLCNERRIEFQLSAAGCGTTVTVRGYSRYYPAFLEKEVLQMTQRLKEDLA